MMEELANILLLEWTDIRIYLKSGLIGIFKANDIILTVSPNGLQIVTKDLRNYKFYPYGSIDYISVDVKKDESL